MITIITVADVNNDNHIARPTNNYHILRFKYQIPNNHIKDQ